MNSNHLSGLLTKQIENTTLYTRVTSAILLYIASWRWEWVSPIEIIDIYYFYGSPMDDKKSKARNFVNDINQSKKKIAWTSWTSIKE